MDPRDFILPDGSVDTKAAMAAGRRARAETARAGASGLIGFLRSKPTRSAGTRN